MVVSGIDERTLSLNHMLVFQEMCRLGDMKWGLYM